MTTNTFYDKRKGMSDLEYGLNIQRGLVPGHDVVHKFGRNPDIDTADNFVDIWNDDNGDGHYTGFDATVAEVVEVFSDDSNDNATGTGAQLVQLVGLGVGFVEQTEIVTLNGTTPVDSTLAYLRLDTVLVLTAGSAGGNQGTITGRQSITVANVFFNIPPTANRTTICALTIPAGKIGYIVSGFATIAKKGTASSEVKAMVRFPGSVFQVVEWFAIHSQGSSYLYRDFKIPLVGIPAGTDVKVAANTDSNSIAIAAGLEVILVDV